MAQSCLAYASVFVSIAAARVLACKTILSQDDMFILSQADMLTLPPFGNPYHVTRAETRAEHELHA